MNERWGLSFLCKSGHALGTYMPAHQLLSPCAPVMPVPVWASSGWECSFDSEQRQPWMSDQP